MSYCKICGRALKDHKKDVGDICLQVAKNILNKKTSDEKELERIKKSQEYQYARKSAVPNLGTEIPGAARISYHQYRNIEDVEKQGPLMAKKMILKKNLILNMPIDTEGANMNDIIRLSLAKKAIESYPKEPIYPKRMDSIEENIPVLALVKGLKNMNSVLQISKSREELEEIIQRSNPKTRHLLFITEFDSLEDIRKKIRSDYFDRFKFIQEYFNNKENFDLTSDSEADRKRHGEKFFDKYFNDFGFKVPGYGAKEMYSIHSDDTPFFNKMRYFKYPQFLKNQLNQEGLESVVNFLTGKKVKKDGAQKTKTNKERVIAFNPIVFYPNQELLRVGPHAKEQNLDEIIHSLENKWGFKGVQNGNTVSDAERHEHYSQANMALSDLMDVLRIEDPKKMTFGGELSLAIGSLRGAKNSLAFYRPAINTISLSRKKGLGALAHEWGHALEHHFNQKNKTERFRDIDDNFVDQINSFVKKMKNSEEYKKSPSSHRNYLSKSEEVFARVFEAMVNHKLEKAGRKNTYLVSHADNFAYPSKEELESMEAGFDKVIKRMIERS